MCVHTFFGGLEGAILIGPSPMFLGTWGHSPIEPPLWTTNHIIEINMIPMAHLFQFIYMRIELWKETPKGRRFTSRTMLSNSLEG